MVSVWFDGVEELTKLSVAFDRVAKEALPLARVAVAKACADIKADAQKFVPVDTGNLKNTIGFETRELSGGVVGEVGPTANYGAFVEYGTSRHGPQAFMGPAFDRHAGDLQDVLGQIAARFRG